MGFAVHRELTTLEKLLFTLGHKNFSSISAASNFCFCFSPHLITVFLFTSIIRSPQSKIAGVCLPSGDRIYIGNYINKNWSLFMKLDNKKERSCIVFLKIQFPLPAETFRSQQMFTSVWLQDFYFIIKYLDMVHLVQYFLTETVCLGWFESTKRVILVSVSPADLLPTIKSSIPISFATVSSK